MNLQQLYYFRAVAELEHYTLASNKLQVSQSSLSHAVSDLENELGAPLFMPQGRNVKLTKYGQLFFQYVSQSLDILDEGKSRVSELISPETGMVSLGYLSCLEGLIPQIISNYYNDTQRKQTTFRFFQLSSRDIYAALQVGSMDLAFCTDFESKQYNTHRIGSQELTVIVPKTHPLAELDAVNLTDLRNENLICYCEQCQLHERIPDLFRGVGISPRIIQESSTDSTIINSVASGLGVALIPRPLSAYSDRVKVLNILDHIPKLDLYLVWKKTRHMPSNVKSFRNYILDRDTIIDDYLAKNPIK